MSETCNYLTQPGNVPCGEPATHSYVNPKGRFYVCPAHATQVYRATNKKTNPTPLVTTILAEKKDTHIARAVDQAITQAAAKVHPVYAPSLAPQAPSLSSGKSLSQLYAEMQQSQSEGSDLP